MDKTVIAKWVAIAVTSMWIVTLVAGIFKKEYQTPYSVGLLMSAVAAWLFGDKALSIGRKKQDEENKIEQSSDDARDHPHSAGHSGGHSVKRGPKPRPPSPGPMGRHMEDLGDGARRGRAGDVGDVSE